MLIDPVSVRPDLVSVDSYESHGGRSANVLKSAPERRVYLPGHNFAHEDVVSKLCIEESVEGLF